LVFRQANAIIFPILSGNNPLGIQGIFPLERPFDFLTVPPLIPQEFATIMKSLGAMNPYPDFVKFIHTALCGHPRLLRIFFSVLSHCSVPPLRGIMDRDTSPTQVSEWPTEAKSPDGPPFYIAGYKAFFEEALDHQREHWWRLLSATLTTARSKAYPEIASRFLAEDGECRFKSATPNALIPKGDDFIRARTLLYSRLLNGGLTKSVERYECIDNDGCISVLRWGDLEMLCF